MKFGKLARAGLAAACAVVAITAAAPSADAQQKVRWRMHSAFGTNLAVLGRVGPFIADRQAYVGGSTPVNVDGGLKSKGHPIGATGCSMAYEIVSQLRGDCGDRQVPDADVGLTHNVGGIGQSLGSLVFSFGMNDF